MMRLLEHVLMGSGPLIHGLPEREYACAAGFAFERRQYRTKHDCEIKARMFDHAAKLGSDTKTPRGIRACMRGNRLSDCRVWGAMGVRVPMRAAVLR